MPAVSATDPVASFEALVQQSQAAATNQELVYFNERKTAWAHRRATVVDVRYDVKKTDSLVNPVEGIVTFTMQDSQTALVETKQAAEADTVYRSPFIYKVSMSYQFKASRWKFSRLTYEGPLPMAKGSKFTVEKDGLDAEPTATPNWLINRWLSGSDQ